MNQLQELKAEILKLKAELLALKAKIRQDKLNQGKLNPIGFIPKV